jgi:hypothetical protein
VPPRPAAPPAPPARPPPRRAREAVDGEKYAYFKANRHMLPDEINQHSDEISKLMLNGMSAEQAFGEVISKYFD